MTVLGRVAALRRFPVKSMAGELLHSAQVGWSGLEGDRQFAFLRADDTSHFPWLTGRQLPELLLHTATGTPHIQVATPGGATLDVTDPALAASLAAAYGRPVSLLRLARGCYDAMPVSLLTTTLVAALAAAHAQTPDPLRFRANILIEPTGAADERDWAGADLFIGEVRLRTTYPTGRCAMIGIDPTTATRDPTLLRTVAQHFAGTIGLYATVAQPGCVSLGDPVRLV